MSDYYVTDIREVNRKKQIFINEKSAFALYNSEVRKFHIQVNQTIPEEVYEEIVQEVLPKRATIRAMHLLKNLDMSEFTLREKLSKGFYPAEAIDAAVEYVKRYGYINDRRYAENYVHFKGEAKSRRQMEEFLRNKGIAQELIAACCDDYYADHGNQEYELARKLLHKKCKDTSSLSYEEKGKLMAFLGRKGFQFDTIRAVLEEADKDCDC